MIMCMAGGDRAAASYIKRKQKNFSIHVVHFHLVSFYLFFIHEQKKPAKSAI